MTCRMARANGLTSKPVEIGVMLNLPNLMIAKPIRQSAYFSLKLWQVVNVFLFPSIGSLIGPRAEI